MQSRQDQKERRGAQGIESSVHVLTGEEGQDSLAFHVSLSLSPSISSPLSPSYSGLFFYCTHVQPDVLLHTNVFTLTAALNFPFVDVPWQRCDVLTTRC